MRAFAKAALAAAVATLLAGQRTMAESMLWTIRAPRDCPEGLTVKSKVASGGMLDFDVSVDEEQIAQAGELYKGRVRSNAVLRISTSGQEVASVMVRGAAEGRRTHYPFRLAPSAAKSSELQLGVSLHEKDGFQTLGGSVHMRIYLTGFQPPSERSR